MQPSTLAGIPYVGFLALTSFDVDILWK
jgi:hypothetical protein